MKSCVICTFGSTQQPVCSEGLEGRHRREQSPASCSKHHRERDLLRGEWDTERPSQNPLHINTEQAFQTAAIKILNIAAGFSAKSQRKLQVTCMPFDSRIAPRAPQRLEVAVGIGKSLAGVPQSI